MAATSANSNTISGFLDNNFSGVPAHKLILGTAAATIITLQAFEILKNGQLPKRAKAATWRTIRAILDPIVIKKEISTACKDIHFPSAGAEETYFDAIPEDGLSEEEVLALSTALHSKLDHQMNETFLSGAVYWGTKNYENMLMKVIQQHLWSNSLFPDYFGSVRKMEAEVANMVLKLFNGNAKTMAATYAFGGTETILLTMLAYRNEARARGIAHPEVIMCQNAHPAFDKAGFYYGIRMVKVPFDPITTRIVVSEVEKNINSNTIGIVGSAPNFATGAVDPIAELAALALRNNVLMHVDACLGGFVVQFMERAGFEQPTIDFRLPGVSSITADIHKWGGCPKGASVCMFRTKELRSRHVFACSDFPGGLYVTGTTLGSRPGFIPAAAWATVLRAGMKQYTQCCATAVKGTREVADYISNHEHLRLMAPADVTTVSFTSDTIDIYLFLKEMKNRGFLFSALQFPPGLHLALTLEHTEPAVMAKLKANITEVVAMVLKEQGGPLKHVQHKAMMYGSSQSVPDRSIIDDVLRGYVDIFYTNKSGEEGAAAEGAKKH